MQALRSVTEQNRTSNFQESLEKLDEFTYNA